jgi:hemolysin activation/secretion protein
LRTRREDRWIAACAALNALFAAAPAPASAQQIFGPGQERPPLEQPGEQPEPLELPPVPPPAPEEPLSRGIEVYVRAFAFEGNSVFSAEQLSHATAPYTGRTIRSEELLRAAEAVTALYAEHGYVTSGAVVPDQSVEDGVVRIQIVEGRLSAIEVSGNRWFRERYFRDRLQHAADAPLSVTRLERELRVLQRNPHVARLNARLEPGAQLGESVLFVAVEEVRPYGLVAEANNEHSPAIGAIGGRFTPHVANLLGHADELEASFDVTDGLFEWEARYELPVNSYDTRVAGYARQSDADVVEEPFDELGIHSESETYGASVSHPLYRDELHELWFRVAGERRELESCLEILPPDCEPFPFLVGQPDPKQVATVLRLIQDWTRASQNDVVAGRMTSSIGVDLLDASVSGDADAQFFAWLGQIQWAHRFSERLLGTELVMRGDLQVADDSLLTLEKFALGGQRTVRGYRENELVRDNGAVGSLELRIPVVRTGLGRPVVELVPFADVGYGWDAGGDAPDRTLSSLGVGVRISPWPWLRGELYWGGRLRNVSTPEDEDLQDDGIHFRVTVLPIDPIARIWE